MENTEIYKNGGIIKYPATAWTKCLMRTSSTDVQKKNGKHPEQVVVAAEYQFPFNRKMFIANLINKSKWGFDNENGSLSIVPNLPKTDVVKSNKFTVTITRRIVIKPNDTVNPEKAERIALSKCDKIAYRILQELINANIKAAKDFVVSSYYELRKAIMRKEKESKRIIKLDKGEVNSFYTSKEFIDHTQEVLRSLSQVKERMITNYDSPFAIMAKECYDRTYDEVGTYQTDIYQTADGFVAVSGYISFVEGMTEADAPTVTCTKVQPKVGIIFA